LALLGLETSEKKRGSKVENILGMVPGQSKSEIRRLPKQQKQLPKKVEEILGLSLYAGNANDISNTSKTTKVESTKTTTPTTTTKIIKRNEWTEKGPISPRRRVDELYEGKRLRSHSEAGAHRKEKGNLFQPTAHT